MKSIIKLLCFSCLLYSACSEDAGVDADNSDSLDAYDVNIIDDDNLTFYLIPSPKDMFAFIKKGNLAFSSEVLNPQKNSDKYLDTKSQEIGFGIYSADLAYTAAFSRVNEATEYLKIVRNLSVKIGISSVFDDSLIKRFENMPNNDSLIRITNDTYYDIVKFLEENERDASLAMLSTGGWLESLYIVINLKDKYSENDNVIQLIADQKNVFENLILYLGQHSDDENIKEVIKELLPIKKIYEELEVVKIENAESVNSRKNQIIVGGATKIVINEKQFNKLKETIINVRNKLAENNI